MLLGKSGSVCSAVDGHAVDRDVVGEAFHLAIDLLGEFAGGRHHDAVYIVFCFGHVGQAVDDGEQIGGGFSGASLGYGY